MKPNKYKDYQHQKKKKRIFISLFLSLCDSDEFIFFVIRYTHIDEMLSCYARRLSTHDAKTVPELLEEVFPHKQNSNYFDSCSMSKHGCQTTSTI